MDIKTYAKSLTPLERKRFCALSGISQVYLSQLISDRSPEDGRRTAGRKSIVSAVVASEGKVTFEDECKSDLIEAKAYLRAMRKAGEAA